MRERYQPGETRSGWAERTDPADRAENTAVVGGLDRDRMCHSWFFFGGSFGPGGVAREPACAAAAPATPTTTSHLPC